MVFVHRQSVKLWEVLDILIYFYSASNHFSHLLYTDRTSSYGFFWDLRNNFIPYELETTIERSQVCTDLRKYTGRIANRKMTIGTFRKLKVVFHK